MEMHKMPFVWQNKTHNEANSSISQTLTLNVFFDDHYFPHIKVAKKETKHDWSIYNKHMRAQLGRYLIVDLTNPVLDVWAREQIVAGYQRSTINKHIFLLNRLLNLARHWGYVPAHRYNQQNIQKLVLGDFKQRFLDKPEIDQLLKHCRASSHPFLYLVIQLLLHTGARVGEVRTLKWRDINFKKRIWTVPVSKNGRSRRIVLSDAAVEILNAARTKSEQLLLDVSDDTYVFRNPKSGRPYRSFYSAWFIVRDNAGLSDVRIHDLRHTFASLLVNKGVSLYEVQTLLGHSSMQMTQRYAHLAPDLLHTRTELVSSIIKGQRI